MQIRSIYRIQARVEALFCDATLLVFYPVDGRQYPSDRPVLKTTQLYRPTANLQFDYSVAGDGVHPPHTYNPAYTGVSQQELAAYWNVVQQTAVANQLGQFNLGVWENYYTDMLSQGLGDIQTLARGMVLPW